MTILRRLVTIAFFVEVGLLLLVVPWTGFLDRNYFVRGNPVLIVLLANGYVKGAISGIGVMNLWAGLAELIELFAGDRSDQSEPPIGHV